MMDAITINSWIVQDNVDFLYYPEPLDNEFITKIVCACLDYKDTIYVSPTCGIWLYKYDGKNYEIDRKSCSLLGTIIKGTSWKALGKHGLCKPYCFLDYLPYYPKEQQLEAIEIFLYQTKDYIDPFFYSSLADIERKIQNNNVW